MLANRLKTLNPYKPGEQLNDREYIKLNANENPFSPPKEVAEAVMFLLSADYITGEVLSIRGGY